MPNEKKHIPKVRVNVMFKPELLKRVDAASGPYERSAYISKACVEKLEKDKDGNRGH